MEIKINGNNAQLPKLLMQAPIEISVEGRGTGKSFDIGFKMDQIVRLMPGAVVALTGKTFGQLLTRTLPSSLKLLNQMGYQKDVNYIIGRRPPKWFKESYEAINKFDNVISFSNGTRFAMISQSEPGSGRGANVDYEIIDEALLIDREQYNNEVSPTNRGNLEHFGKLSKHPVPMHHGYKYSTSMPVDKSGRWIMDYADYYLKERGIRLLDVWNRIVGVQLEVLDAAADYKKERALAPDQAAPIDSTASPSPALKRFTEAWNEAARLKRQITPFVSSSGVLFTLSNAFDNLQMLGIDYLLQNRARLPYMIFMIEIMNLYYDKVEDGFYSIDNGRHVYYGNYDLDRVRHRASVQSYVPDDDAFQSSIYDKDCDTNAPLELAFDWGSTISLMTVFQERQWDFTRAVADGHNYMTQINEFFVKPEGQEKVMISALIEKFTTYYQPHHNRTIIYYADRYGDHRNPTTLNAATFNEMAIEALEREGWRVQVRRHSGMEPPQSDKYLLWGLILNEQQEALPRFRINGDRCKYTLISMCNARVKGHDGRFQKDKSSERASSGVLPEEATHFSDAVDKIFWTKYGDRLRSQNRQSYIRLPGR